MHTKGKLVTGRHDVDSSRIDIGLKLKQHFCTIAEVVCFDVDDMNYEEDRDNATHLVLCWNTHDDLLAACKEAIRTINTLPKPDDKVKEAVETLTHLQQAIGKAEKGERKW